jgi:hypothetical protein
MQQAVQAEVVALVETCMNKPTAQMMTNIFSNKNNAHMDGRTAFVEIVRASIVGELKKHGVTIPEHTAKMAEKLVECPIVNGLAYQPYTYQMVEQAFRWNLERFEAGYGELMERDLFMNLGLTPETFDESSAFVIIAEELVERDKPTRYGTVVSYVAFLCHICVNRVKAGGTVDEKYLDLVLANLVELPNWCKLCEEWVDRRLKCYTD